jgi:hypothetical protein
MWKEEVRAHFKEKHIPLSQQIPGKAEENHKKIGQNI